MLYLQCYFTQFYLKLWFGYSTYDKQFVKFVTVNLQYEIYIISVYIMKKVKASESINASSSSSFITELI